MLIVLVAHSVTPLIRGSPFEILCRFVPGFVGVQIFFTISGFIITHLLAKEILATTRVSLHRFWLRRALRILPVLFAFLGVTLVLRTLGLINFTQTEWLSALFFIRNMVEGGWITGHCWSLAVEAHFYLFWPIVLSYTPKTQWPNLCVVGIVLGPFFRLVTAGFDLSNQMQFTLPFSIDCFAFGALLAIKLNLQIALPTQRSVTNFAPKNLMLGPLVIIALLLSFLTSTRWSTLAWLFQPTLVGVIAFSIIHAFLSHPDSRISRVFSHNLLVHVGLISYSIYIWQQMLFIPNAPWFPQLSPILNFVLMSGLLAMIAMLSYRFFEHPLKLWREKLRS